jgi:hypothetical protein
MTGTKLAKEARQLLRKLHNGEITLEAFNDTIELLKKECFRQAQDVLRRADAEARHQEIS